MLRIKTKRRYLALSPQHYFLPSPQVSNRLQRLISRLDGLAVKFEGTLCLDERDQFFHWINVAGFEEILDCFAGPIFTGITVDCVARSVRFDVDASTKQLQPLRIDELADLKLTRNGARGIAS